jgi:3-hydroxyisobutyrate dehydrogenase-like beta-hydroxyacid dehydrogenase
MDIGFIGLGKMGFPMARRLIEARHQLVVFDQRKEAVDKLVALGAQAASSPKDVADRAETVLASLPSLQASLEVSTGESGVIEGKRARRFFDLSTVGRTGGAHSRPFGQRNIAARQPVSGGVGGAGERWLPNRPRTDSRRSRPRRRRQVTSSEKPGSRRP